MGGAGKPAAVDRRPRQLPFGFAGSPGAPPGASRLRTRRQSTPVALPLRVDPEFRTSPRSPWWFHGPPWWSAGSRGGSMGCRGGMTGSRGGLTGSRGGMTGRLGGLTGRRGGVRAAVVV